MTGYHATIVVREPGGCPVALASDEADAPVDSVSRSSTAGETPIVEEFGVQNPSVDLERSGIDGATGVDAATSGDGATGADGTTTDGVALERVYETEGSQVYRFERDWAEQCVCEVVESGGTPVSSLRATGGELHLSVHATDVDSLSETIGELQERFDGVKLRELTETGESSTSDLVIVDRARLTDRQRDVLETAHEMGYFEYPKGANAGEVAQALGVSGSTFAEHLAAAQTKLLRALLAESSRRE